MAGLHPQNCTHGLRYVYMYIHMQQRLKNIGLVTGPGGRFATSLVTESGGLATTLSATSLSKTTVLYTDAR